MRSARAYLPKPRKTMRVGPATGGLSRQRLLEERVSVAVGRHAAAVEAQRRRGGDLMPGTRGDERSLARSHPPHLPVDLQLALALEHDVDLLARAVVVALR